MLTKRTKKREDNDRESMFPRKGPRTISSSCLLLIRKNVNLESPDLRFSKESDVFYSPSLNADNENKKPTVWGQMKDISKTQLLN